MKDQQKGKQIKKKINSWKKQGYDVSELQSFFKNKNELFRSSRRKTAIIVSVIFVSVIDFIFFSMGTMVSSP